jgi:Short repeat of unknown function (DUF308)
MSASTPARPASSRADTAGYEAEQHGLGWVTFAGAMLAIIGVLNIIYGIAAIDNAHVYANNTSYVFGDLNTWGWFLVVIGAIQFLAAFSIWNQTEWGRWVGIVSAGGNAILMLLFLPAFPFLALSLFTIDILVMYGLIAYGGRRHAA